MIRVPYCQKLILFQYRFPDGSQETLNTHHNILKRNLRIAQCLQEEAPLGLHILIISQCNNAVEAFFFISVAAVLKRFLWGGRLY